MSWLNDSVVVMSIAGAISIFALSTFVLSKLMKGVKTGEMTGDRESETEYDGIGKLNNAYPITSALVFLGLIAWAYWYMIVAYPVNSFSQIGQYNEEVQAHEQVFAQKVADIDNAGMLATGKNIFNVQCTACHGVDAKGVNGQATSLRDWTTQNAIEEVIKNGSKGLGYPLGDMPGGMASGDENIKVIAKYVADGLKGSDSAKNLFTQSCSACHGVDGAGMNGMSPNLVEYRNLGFFKEVLKRGKKGSIGEMPKFASILTQAQQDALGMYVLSLSKDR